MTRKTGKDFHPEVLKLFDKYVHGQISRRGFVDNAAQLLHYAETDERINAAWPAFATALKSAGVKYQVYKYPGTQHGFNNDTTPRYDEAAAKLAWQRTVSFFNTQLRI